MIIAEEMRSWRGTEINGGDEDSNILTHIWRLLGMVPQVRAWGSGYKHRFSTGSCQCRWHRCCNCEVDSEWKEVGLNMVRRLLVEGTVAVEEVGTNAATSWSLLLLRFGEDAINRNLNCRYGKQSWFPSESLKIWLVAVESSISMYWCDKPSVKGCWFAFSLDWDVTRESKASTWEENVG